MKKLYTFFRIASFIFILSIGLSATLFVGETTGLALADLSNTSVNTMIESPHGEVMYAVLDGDAERRGIYRSDVEGRAWLKVSTGPDASVNALAVHPANAEVLYAGTKGGSIYEGSSLWYSNDNGTSWNPNFLNLPADPNGNLPAVSVLTVDPAHPGALYVGTEGQGMYRFQVRTQEYELIGGSALRNLYVNDIISSEDGHIYALTTQAIFDIEGVVSKQIESLPDLAVSLAIDPVDPNTLYAGTVASGAYRSTDGGTTWEAINTALGVEPGVILSVSAITIDEDNRQHLALATAYGVGSHLAGGAVYESFDAGRSWIKLGATQNVVTQLTIKEGGVYVATFNGLVRYGEPLTTPSLASWLKLQPLVNPIVVQALIIILTIGLASWVLFGWVPRLPKIGHQAV